MRKLPTIDQSSMRRRAILRTLEIPLNVYEPEVELYGRESGFDRGRGDPIHLFFPPRRHPPTTPSPADRRRGLIYARFLNPINYEIIVASGK